MSTDIVRSNRRLWVAVLVLAIIASVAGTLAVLNATSQRDDAQTGEKEAKATTRVVGGKARDLANEVLSACAGDSKDARALRAAGLCGKASDTKTEVAQALPGAAGAPGPAGAAGSAGVAGQTGPPGTAGTSGTDGTTGTTGGAGPTGASGPPGPAGTDGKDGSDGQTGPQGPQGDPGRSIDNAVCGDDGRWTITYSDGTTSDGGVCRVDLLP